MAPSLFAISDMHVGFPENRKYVDQMCPDSPDDWLIIAGDVGEYMDDVEWALRTLSERFALVIWTPGNHELWTPRDDPVQLRGKSRYDHLVALCAKLGVVSPEDPFPVWEHAGGPVTIVPLFLLYDYTFLPPGFTSMEDALTRAHDVGVVCMDEWFLHPDPYPSRQEWSRERVALAEQRLRGLAPEATTLLVNHFPLVRDPTRVLRYPEFSLWCGTERTACWHVRYRAAVVVYGHLHIPRRMWIDGVRFEEVSMGYPREWQARGRAPAGLRRVFGTTEPLP